MLAGIDAKFDDAARASSVRGREPRQGLFGFIATRDLPSRLRPSRTTRDIHSSSSSLHVRGVLTCPRDESALIFGQSNAPYCCIQWTYIAPTADVRYTYAVSRGGGPVRAAESHSRSAGRRQTGK
jgi:hypothetical protein